MEYILNYEIIEKIVGSKKDYELFKCKKKSSEDIVLIKKLKPGLPSSNDIAKFKFEYDLIMNLDIDGIVKVLDVIIDKRDYYLVMDYFESISLKKCIAKTVLDLKNFMEIGIQLCNTLGELHNEDIVHENISSYNVLVNSDLSSVKLINFGVTELITQGNNRIYNKDVIKNHLYYISPEKTGILNRNVDHRSDIYSLGIVFYEMLFGKVPFKSSDPLELYNMHIVKNLEFDESKNVPKIIIEILKKMLAKKPEERYQNTFGIAYDLQKCLKQYTKKKEISKFKLGEKDIPIRFKIPQIMVGRENEIEILRNSFNNVVKGDSQLVMVKGGGGIGKSELVNEVHKYIVGKGFFISGKYEQYRRDNPYSAITQAFQKLIRQILVQTDDTVLKWKNKIKDVLGKNGKLITDLISDLESLIGRQTVLPDLNQVEINNLFSLTFKDFVSVFANENYPLVLFLDDFHCASKDDFKLVTSIISNVRKHILIVLAYRDEEVADSVFFDKTVNEIKLSNINVVDLSLDTLSKYEVHIFVSNFLQVYDKKEHFLGDLIYSKTQGNPFFVTQFLSILYSQKLLYFEESKGWVWDENRIKEIDFTNDVVQLLMKKIKSKSENVVNILKVCACIGNRFDISILEYVLRIPIGEVLFAIRESIKEGFVSMGKEGYYVFHHDRIQEAAYSLISEKEKVKLHYMVGSKTLSDIQNPQILEYKLFYIVDHLNLGSGLIFTSTERENLIKLNIKAAHKAMSCSSYAPGLRYIEFARKLLDKNCWETQYNIAMRVFVLNVELLYLNCEYEEVHKLGEVGIRNINNVIEKSKIYKMKIEAYNAKEDYFNAIKSGVEILNLLGVKISAYPGKLDLLYTLGKVKLALLNRDPRSLLNLPQMTNPKSLASMDIFPAFGTAAYLSNPELFAIAGFRVVLVALEYGNSKVHPFLYISYAVISIVMFDDIDTGYKFGELMIGLVEKYSIKSVECRTRYIYNFLIRHWKEHLRDTTSSMLDAHQIGIETGDLEYMSFCLLGRVTNLYGAGEDLRVLKEDALKYRRVIRRFGHKYAVIVNGIVGQTILNLLGENKNPTILQGELFDVKKELSVIKKANDKSALFNYYYAEFELNYLFGKYFEAEKFYNNAKKNIGSVAGMYYVRCIVFYHSLNGLAMYNNLSGSQKRRILKDVKKNQKKINMWAKFAPMNNLHKYYLVEAEKHRVLNNDKEATNCYDKSIYFSKKYEYLNDEALGNELAAKFYLGQKKMDIAKKYFDKAIECYKRWGAFAKLKHLEEEFPELG